MFIVDVKAQAHPVQVTTLFRATGKRAIVIVRPGEKRDFIVNNDLEHEFEEVVDEPLLGHRAGEEPVDPMAPSNHVMIAVSPTPTFVPASTCHPDRPDAGRA